MAARTPFFYDTIANPVMALLYESQHRAVGKTSNTMTTLLKEMAATDMPVLERMFQYYLYDMSEHAGWPLSQDGAFAYPPDLLPPYWSEHKHYAYLIVHDGEIAGFCLVRPSPDDLQVWDIGQFFVLRKFRNCNLGSMAFEEALAMHPGQWQVRVLPVNVPAYQFWKSRIAKVTDGHFSEISKMYGDIEMTYFTFTSNT